jgi:hypothetical protein
LPSYSNNLSTHVCNRSILSFLHCTPITALYKYTFMYRVQVLNQLTKQRERLKNTYLPPTEHDKS